MKIGLGIDTGGTYTDAAIMDLDDGRILARAKSLTTRNDLSIGIKGAIEGIERRLLDDVEVVCLSSTLATNSVVEGKGCRVGLVVMGSKVTVSTKAEESVTVLGRHSASGKEEEPLDEEAVECFLRSVEGKVDCIAVTGFMSVRNPSHEKRVKEMAHEILGIPTVCGHELSSSLGFNERTITCVMNARLIPVIEELLESVNTVLRNFGMDAPLMIVKGDGSVMSEEMARERPVETILSGPASSMNGAMRLTGLKDAIVVDIGGTTTDIGVIRGGKMNLSAEGARIGGFNTRVNAAEITTAGLGGDSRIIVNGDKVHLSTLRVIPLCTASWRYPEIRSRLEKLVSDGPRSIPVAHYERNIIMDTEFFIAVKDHHGIDFTENDIRFIEYVKGVPHSLSEARQDLKEAPISFDVQRMESLGIVQRIGLTPTDIMHIRGTFTAYDSVASELAVKYHAANLGMETSGFMDMIDAMVTEKIATEIARKVINDESETEFEGYGNDLVRRAVTGVGGKDFDVSLRLNKPIVGMGGPSFDMLPKVAERMGTELVIAENYDVGNAIGAISGKVVESIEMLIQTVIGSTLAKPACTVFSRLGRFYYEDYDEGVEAAKRDGIAFVREQAEKAGAVDIQVEVKDVTSEIFIGKEHLKTKVAEMKLVITATGNPASRRRREKAPEGVSSPFLLVP